MACSGEFGMKEIQILGVPAGFTLPENTRSKCGICEILRKPITLAELNHVVRDTLAGASAPNNCDQVHRQRVGQSAHPLNMTPRSSPREVQRPKAAQLQTPYIRIQAGS